MRTPQEMGSALADIEMVVMDVDGVLTDGRITLMPSDDGSRVAELKAFNVKDGLAIRWAARLGVATAFLTARSSPAVSRRAEELEITKLVVGAKDKVAELRRICAECDVSLAGVAYMGDDLADLGPMSVVGLPVTVADAAADVLEAATVVTKAGGGQGAARELIEAILRAKGLWEQVVDAHR